MATRVTMNRRTGSSIMSGVLNDDVRGRTKRRDRAVLRGAGASGIVRLITAASSYVTLGVAARALSKDEFGLVAMAMSLCLILTMLDIGVGGALTTRVAASHARMTSPGSERMSTKRCSCSPASLSSLQLSAPSARSVCPWPSGSAETLPPQHWCAAPC